MNSGPQDGEDPSAPANETQIEPPDSFHLSAAQGWMGLGLLDEAEEELEQVAARWREHYDFLETSWELASRRKDWPRCTGLAESMIKHCPERPSGWIHRSYALHELKQTQEAWDKLKPVASLFPELWTIPYNLACYACQLGRKEDAKVWFRRAMRAGDPKELRQLAQGDPDLAPIKDELG